MAVVTARGRVDAATAELLRVVLLQAGSHARSMLVVDLTQAVSCDSVGLGALVRAHRRAVAEGSGLRLVIGSQGQVAQSVALAHLDRLIPCSASLDEALAASPAMTGRPAT